MAVEAEFPMTMLFHFIVVAFIFFAALWAMFRSGKSRRAMYCFIGQGVLTCAAFAFLFSITGRRAASVDIQLNMILCGISWGLSIVLMLLGCWLLVKKKEGDRGTV